MPQQRRQHKKLYEDTEEHQAQQMAWAWDVYRWLAPTPEFKAAMAEYIKSGRHTKQQETTIFQIYETICNQMGIEPDLVAQERGTKARSNLIRTNMGLVHTVAQKYDNMGIEFDELINEGVIGLARGIEKYDPTRLNPSSGMPYKISTYAYNWIRQSIQRALNSKSRPIRIPCHQAEKISKTRKLARKIAQESGVSVDSKVFQEAMTQLGYNADTQAGILRVIHISRVNSLDKKIDDTGSERTLGDLQASDGISPEKYAIDQSKFTAVRQLLIGLDDREKKIVMMRTGFYGAIPSLEEIGNEYGITRERVRQLEKRAMAKLKAIAKKTPKLIQCLED